MKKLVLVSLLICFSTLFAIKYSFTNPVSDNSFSLLNPNKMTMSHSMTFSTAFNNQNSALYQSVYTNHIDYQISPKIQFAMDLNFINNGTANFNTDFDIEGNNDNKSMIIPGFSMKFQPTENMSIEFHYNQRNPYNSMHNSFYRVTD